MVQAPKTNLVLDTIPVFWSTWSVNKSFVQNILDHFIYKTIILREEGTNFLKYQHSDVSLSDFFGYNHDLYKQHYKKAKEIMYTFFIFSMPKET